MTPSILNNYELKEKVTILEKKISTHEQVDVFKEVFEKYSKKCNIIIFNVPESSTTKTSEDLNLVNSVFPL
jgi:hypothetical protein